MSPEEVKQFEPTNVELQIWAELQLVILDVFKFLEHDDFDQEDDLRLDLGFTEEQIWELTDAWIRENKDILHPLTQEEFEEIVLVKDYIHLVYWTLIDQKPPEEDTLEITTEEIETEIETEEIETEEIETEEIETEDI
jgi:hypothetical protein